MNKLEEIEKKNQQLREHYNKEKEAVSLLKKENTRLKKELQDINTMFQKTPAGIVLIWHGRILEVNETFLGFMGYKKDEMINRNFLNFIHPGNLSEVRFIHNRWNSGKISNGHYDTRLITESDETILCSIEAKRIRYRGRASYILNVTRLENRAELQKKEKYETRKSMEYKMVAGFTSLLKKRTDAITGLLRSIKSPGDFPAKNLDQTIVKLKTEQKNILKEIRMLEVIKGEKDDFNDKKVTGINRIIDEAIRRVNCFEEAGEIDIKTYLRASSALKGSHGDLTEAFTQLLLNSVLNVSGVGEIHVTTEENAEKIYVYIQDSGLSVRENRVEDIFMPFSSGDSSLVHEVGMRFARAVIEASNGEIEYLASGGQGNIFQITLPAFNEPPKRRKVDRNKLKKARILIIQPDDIAKELLSHLLTEKGCSVDNAGSIAEGFAAIKKKKINLLVADIEGLGVNNRAFWKKCRHINPGLITIGLKNGSGINNNEQPEETGPDHMILKPYNIKQAVTTISEIFMVEY
ncbi:MAG: PAS domain S-box protein [Deltaproteobacteria bacterium]|nr:PAS domain S-box protein [Deltaproteobacteria bacterium]